MHRARALSGAATWSSPSRRSSRSSAFTAIVGTLLASPGLPPLAALVFGNLGIALAAACAATINHVLDRRIDEQMARTRARPLPTGALTERSALIFAAVLGCRLDGDPRLPGQPADRRAHLRSLIGYAVIYTVWLKRATSQNIVIGGAAGAAPPVLGWAAVTNSVDPNALLLFLIIFVWTPPHFWALAIARRDEYARAGIPMLPVTHGVAYTRLQVLLYTVLLVLVTLMPFLTRMSGLIYLAAALVLNCGFLYYALALKITARAGTADARVPLLGHLSHVAVRRAARRSLPAGAARLALRAGRTAAPRRPRPSCSASRAGPLTAAPSPAFRGVSSSDSAPRATCTHARRPAASA